jgi:D-alanyl-D-alanine carboxypeptidase
MIKKLQLFIALTCPIILITSCKKNIANTATIACTPDFGFADSSAKHPKANIYQALSKKVTDAGVPGMNVMIEDANGLWSTSLGMADIGNNTPMQICHSTKIASVTKFFTAVLAYKLIEQGKLKLTDKISQYIDADIIAKIKNSEQATIADLMQHSSGIYDFVFSPDYILYTFNNLEEQKGYEKLLSFAYNKKPAFEFGAKRSYNFTVNYILLAMAINKIAGKDHAQLERELVFNPLNMSHTFFRPTEEIPWNTVARGYFDYRKPGTVQDLTQLFTGDGSGFTGIYSTVNDMRKYMNALFKDKSVLSDASLTSLMATNNLDSAVSYGVGSRVYAVSNSTGAIFHFYGHPGGEVNYASGCYYCPELKATVTYILNYGDAFDGAFSPAYATFRKEIFKAVVN